jgi:hypothetical protein
MLVEDEQRFLEYWEQNRDKKKNLLRQLLAGLPLGLLIGLGVVLSLNLQWYERANMVANARLNPFVLLIAIICISCFCSIFYKRYKWDMNEQRYKELIYKKQKEHNLESS